MVLSTLSGSGVSKDDVLVFLREYKTRECGGCEQLIGFQQRATGALVCDPNCTGRRERDLAVGMAGGGAAGVSKQDVLTFLRQYKALECQCCDQLIGFQHRGTGLVYCNPDCAGTGAKGPAMIGDPAGSVPNGPSDVAKVEQRRVVEVVGSTAPLKKIPDVPAAAAPLKKTQDVADGGGVYLAGGLLAKRVPPSESTMISPIMNASNYRVTDKNPFVKPVPILTEKEVAPAPARGRLIDTVPAPKAKEPEPEEVEVVNVLPNPNGNREVIDEDYRFMWKYAKYSPYIVDMCKVKVSFAWSVKEFQVVTEEDEPRVVEYQAKIQDYVQKRGTPLAEPPVIGQMVFAEYNGEYYRGRVTDAVGDKCSIFFVDFGDRLKDVEYTTLIKPEVHLMDAPIYSIYVSLADVPDLKRKAKLKGDLEAYMYGDSFSLKIVDPIHVGRKNDVFSALLLDKGTSIGGRVQDYLKKLPDATWEEKVAALENERKFLFSDENRVDLQRAVEFRMKEKFESYRDNFLESTVMDFTLSDIRYPVLDISGKPVDACIRYASGLSNLYVFPTSPRAFQRNFELMSLLCEEYLADYPISSRLTNFELETNGVYLVKFLPWEEMEPFLKRTKMTEARKRRSVLNFDDLCYRNNKSPEFSALWGKWFRSYVRNRVSGDCEHNEYDCYWHCLIDYGITIAVPNQFVARINAGLMVPPSCVFPVKPIYQSYERNPSLAEHEAATAIAWPLNFSIKFVPIFMYEEHTVVALSPESDNKIRTAVTRRMKR